MKIEIEIKVKLIIRNENGITDGDKNKNIKNNISINIKMIKEQINKYVNKQRQKNEP